MTDDLTPEEEQLIEDVREATGDENAERVREAYEELEREEADRTVELDRVSLDLMGYL